MARHRFQAGHVFKRGKRRKLWVGRWREFTLVGGTLKRKQRSAVLGPCSEMSKGNAERKLHNLLRPINDGSHSPMQTMGFGEFCTRWEHDILCHYRESTRGFYKATLDRWILPHFRDWRLDEVTTPEVQRFMNQFAAYSKPVLKRIRATLSVLMTTAVDWQYLERNPLHGVRLPPGKPVKRARVLTPEQVRLIIANLEEPYSTVVVLTFLEGLRESETLALKWQDFDLRRQVVQVRRSFYRGKLGSPKTRESEREIPYGSVVQEAVLHLASSKHNHGEFLFIAPKGGFFSPQRITRTVFKPLAERIGLPPFTWRSLRRSAETTMHNSGIPLKVQQQILGHADPNITLLYAEPNMDERRRAVQQLESLLFPTVPTFLAATG